MSDILHQIFSRGCQNHKCISCILTTCCGHVQACPDLDYQFPYIGSSLPEIHYKASTVSAWGSSCLPDQ